jgi:hypothetical protein
MPSTPQDWLDILALLASVICRHGRRHGPTAEQPLLSFRLAQSRRATSLGFQHSENTTPLPAGKRLGSHPAPFRWRVRAEFTAPPVAVDKSRAANVE